MLWHIRQFRQPVLTEGRRLFVSVRHYQEPRLPGRRDLRVIHFQPGAFHGINGDTDIPVSSASSSLKCENGVVKVPTGPGFGITVDSAFVRDSVKGTTI